MHINEVGRRLDEIRVIYEEERALKIPYSIIPKEEQKKLESMIEAVFDRYEEAIENNVEYLNQIRKPLNFIKFTDAPCILQRFVIK